MEVVSTSYESPVALGDLVRDKISGFSGVVDSLGFFLNGCLRVGVLSTTLHDGKPNGLNFDVQQLEVIERNFRGLGEISSVFGADALDGEAEHQAPPRPGGPHDMPTRPSIPR
jgi:hypothetical protein